MGCCGSKPAGELRAPVVDMSTAATLDSAATASTPRGGDEGPLVPRILVADWASKHQQEFTTSRGWDYPALCRSLFDERGAAVHSHAIRRCSERTSVQKLLYMNFQSHNILDPAKAEQMFELLGKVDASIVCLSEALVPNAVAEATAASAGSLYELKSGAVSVIQQPLGPNIAPAFESKKLKDYNGAAKTTPFAWEAQLYGLGYRWLIFGNPEHCPWGSNWGNVMIMKTKPTEWAIHHLPVAQEKRGFGTVYKEGRCAISAKSNGVWVTSTHLENADEEVRVGQATDLMAKLAKQSPGGTLVGDMNTVNPQSYTPDEQRMMLDAWYPKRSHLPTKAYDALSGGKAALNTGQKYESLYQKCVTHAWSTVYTDWVMPFTDVTDFDHQPLVLLS